MAFPAVAETKINCKTLYKLLFFQKAKKVGPENRIEKSKIKCFLQKFHIHLHVLSMMTSKSFLHCYWMSLRFVFVVSPTKDWYSDSLSKSITVKNFAEIRIQKKDPRSKFDESRIIDEHGVLMWLLVLLNSAICQKGARRLLAGRNTKVCIFYCLLRDCPCRARSKTIKACDHPHIPDQLP